MSSPVRDGCEWSPERGGPAYTTDEHHWTTPATMIVGANGKWRLCSSCAALPAFKRHRKRKPISDAKARLQP